MRVRTENRQQAIVEVALEVFHKFGFERASTATISRRLGESRRGQSTGRSSNGRMPGGRTPLCKCREGASRDPVDNVRAFHLGAYLVLRMVRTTAAPVPLDPVFAMAGSDPVDGGSHLAQNAYRAGTLLAHRDLLIKSRQRFPT